MAKAFKPVPQRAWWIALIPMIIAYLADLWTKETVLANMSEGERIVVIEPVLSWHFIRNPGAAFSIGTDYTWIFTIIQAAGLLIVLCLIVFRARTLPWLITLGSLAGGIAGNLTDRLFREPGFGIGHVIDFIALPNFAIFNIADSFIVVSIIVIVILVMMGKTLDGKPETDDTAHNQSDGSPASGDRD
ncbi:signal peptidase II [Enteractinococcus coprophilus]|uniref:Lipoprotein signal peptidase n=1 Tax=Enteractinococcus coprophilus TaxID=1027633 RepID=A0A543AJW9_9MICC|nr:signal peptidase II [Enteractinococcus coprophilus]